MKHRTFSTALRAAAVGARIGINGGVAAICLIAGGSLYGCAELGSPSSPAASSGQKQVKLVHSPLESTTDAQIPALTLNTVLVYPLDTMVGEMHQVTKETLEQATADLISKMQVATSLQVLNADSTKDVAGAIAKTRGTALPLKERALTSAKSTEAQAVLYGVISKFNDAEGSSLGETGKSEVSFQLFLADVRTGSVVWNANFTDSNQPLSENIFRLGNVAKQGFKYKSAGQILVDGFGLAAVDLEKARKRQS